MTLQDKFNKIEALRANSKHDLYIIAGQLNESNIDPVDSWTFFKWLQTNNIPSVYILKKKDLFYNEAKNHKNVIAFDSWSWGGQELLDLTDVWSRACAFVVEWDLGGSEVDFWIKNLPDCRYVFLQHGVIGTCISKVLQYPCRNIYNDINTTSLKEIELIMGDEPNYKCFIAGLPRFDLYNKTKENNKEKIVLIMFTWRNLFSQDPEKLFYSEYWLAIKSILSHKIVIEGKKKGVKFVAALHHSLIRSIDNLENFQDIPFIEQKDIQKYIRKADALITDFSSISHDFIFQNKPVIFYLPDKDDPIYEKGSVDRIKLDSAKVRRKEYFNYTDDINETMRLLQKYIDNNFTLEPEKIKIAETFFKNKSNFSQHIYQNIEERLTAERVSLKYWLEKEKRNKEEFDKQIEVLDRQLEELGKQLNEREKKIKKIRHKRKIIIYLLIIYFIFTILFTIFEIVL